MATTVTRRTIDLAGLDVPFVEFTGSEDGPLLTVISGVHGCEYASMDGVRRWTRSLESRELRGRVRAVPVLNLHAFQQRTPFLVPDDGKNLNRCFPGDPAGTLSDRLAYAAFTQLITGSDAYIDAHCGDMVEALEPFALYNGGGAGEDGARDMAVAYGLPYIIRQAPGPDADRPVSGTSSSAAAAIGIPAITAESGECGLVQEEAVAKHVRGLNGVLELLGIADLPEGSAATAEPTYLDRFLWMYTERGGWWAPTVRTGEHVTEGQVIGTISTLDGSEVLETITAPADSVPIFITSSPAVADDGLLLGLGIV
jgi:predicted deacylase